LPAAKAARNVSEFKLFINLKMKIVYSKEPIYTAVPNSSTEQEVFEKFYNFFISKLRANQWKSAGAYGGNKILSITTDNIIIAFRLTERDGDFRLTFSDVTMPTKDWDGFPYGELRPSCEVASIISALDLARDIILKTAL